MAAATGFSHTTIRRIWNAFGLQPHRWETFKLSRDLLFVDRVRDIVGLYLSPPNRTLYVVGILLFTGWKGWEMVYNHHVAVLDAPGQTSSKPVTQRSRSGRPAA
jgi:hypothetical protein